MRIRKLSITTRLDGFWSGVAAGAAASVDVYSTPRMSGYVNHFSGVQSDREALERVAFNRFHILPP
jgi:hypothetical protein